MGQGNTRNRPEPVLGFLKILKPVQTCIGKIQTLPIRGRYPKKPAPLLSLEKSSYDP